MTDSKQAPVVTALARPEDSSGGGVRSNLTGAAALMPFSSLGDASQSYESGDEKSHPGGRQTDRLLTLLLHEVKGLRGDLASRSLPCDKHGASCKHAKTKRPRAEDEETESEGSQDEQVEDDAKPAAATAICAPVLAPAAASAATALANDDNITGIVDKKVLLQKWRTAFEKRFKDKELLQKFDKEDEESGRVPSSSAIRTIRYKDGFAMSVSDFHRILGGTGTVVDLHAVHPRTAKTAYEFDSFDAIKSLFRSGDVKIESWRALEAWESSKSRDNEVAHTLTLHKVHLKKLHARLDTRTLRLELYWGITIDE